MDIDALVAKYRAEPKGTGSPPAPSMVREPAAKSDEELGIDDGPIKAPVPKSTTGNALNAVGTVADDALDAVTGDNYTKARNAIANKVSPGAGDATAGDEAAFNAEHPVVESTARTAAAFSPVGVPAMEAKVLGAVAAPVLKAGVGLFAKGAPERATSRALTALTEDVKQTLKNRITEPRAQVRITKVLAEPEVRQAADNPGKLLEISQKGLQTNGDAARKGYAVLDKKGRGMPVADVVMPLQTLRAEMIARSEDPTAIARVERTISQFQRGMGADPAGVVPSADVREFLTKQVQNPGFGRGDPHVDPPPARAALQEMSGVLKDSLSAYAERHGGKTAAEAMQGLNDKITAYSLMEKSAVERLAKSQQAPGVGKALVGAAMGHKADGIGGMVGYGLGGPMGSLVGLGAAHYGAKAVPIADEILASPAAQKFAQAGVPTRVLSASQQAAQPIVEAVSRGDHEGAKRDLAALVFGQ